MRSFIVAVVFSVLPASAMACDGLAVMQQRSCVQAQVECQAVAPVVQYQAVAPVVQYQQQCVKQPVVVRQKVIQRVVKQPVVVRQKVIQKVKQPVVVRQKIIQRNRLGLFRRH